MTLKQKNLNKKAKKSSALLMFITLAFYFFSPLFSLSNTDVRQAQALSQNTENASNFQRTNALDLQQFSVSFLLKAVKAQSFDNNCSIQSKEAILVSGPAIELQSNLIETNPNNFVQNVQHFNPNLSSNCAQLTIGNTQTQEHLAVFEIQTNLDLKAKATANLSVYHLTSGGNQSAEIIVATNLKGSHEISKDMRLAQKTKQAADNVYIDASGLNYGIQFNHFKILRC